MENIVRLAMEAGPVLTDTEDPPSKVNPFSKEVEVEPTINAVPSDDQNQTLDIVVKEKEEEKAALFESLTRQSSLKAALKPTTSATGNYAMSTPAAEVRLLLWMFVFMLPYVVTLTETLPAKRLLWFV